MTCLRKAYCNLTWHAGCIKTVCNPRALVPGHRHGYWVIPLPFIELVCNKKYFFPFPARTWFTWSSRKRMGTNYHYKISHDTNRLVHQWILIVNAQEDRSWEKDRSWRIGEGQQILGEGKDRSWEKDKTDPRRGINPERALLRLLIGFSKIAFTDWYVTAIAIRYLAQGIGDPKWTPSLHLLSAFNTLDIYKCLERARYPRERSLQHALSSESKESTVDQKKVKCSEGSRPAGATL